MAMVSILGLVLEGNNYSFLVIKVIIEDKDEYFESLLNPFCYFE